MDEDSSHQIVLCDVYIVTHIFSTPTNIKRKLRYYGLPGVLSHYSVLTQNHVFHITSQFAQNKPAYFKGVSRGRANVPLLLKMKDLSTNEGENTFQCRAIYCGQTPYRIPHIEFYAKFVMEFYDHYSVTFSNCLGYAVSLAAQIINGDMQAFSDPFRNGPFVGTLQEIMIRENRHQALRQAGKSSPLCRAGILNLRSAIMVWRIQVLASLHKLGSTPRLCPLTQPPEYGIFPSVDNTYGRSRALMTRYNTDRWNRTNQLMRNYKNTSRW